MPYFNISTGLRGCYMPDNAFVIRANTRRELKRVIESEAYYYRDAGFIGANKKDIATIAASAWRNRDKFQLPYALPLAPSHARKNYCHGIFVSTATRDEFKSYQKECE